MTTTGTDISRTIVDHQMGLMPAKITVGIDVLAIVEACTAVVHG